MFVIKYFNVNLLRNDVYVLLRRRHMSGMVSQFTGNMVVCSPVSLGKPQII